MNALSFSILILSFLEKSECFDVGLISRYVPSTFTETQPFSPEATDGALALINARTFLNELVLTGNYTSEYGFFKVKDQEIPVIINGWEYYWGAAFHPSILNGTYGCKIPIKWLEDVAENMSNFHYRTKSATEQQESSMKNFLKTIRFTDNTAPTEMAWACISPISRCCGIGCCSKDMKSQSNSIFHSVFGYMCGGFMLLCCFVLLLSLVMFLCNDVWHRYIPWFPSSPRPPATPRGEAHEMQELNPASHRSPSRMHLAA
ncbi:hypothetical protein CAEBREN_29512 [Caenorhabditis brenneri]|uniref:Uncharacterized protein n=1 Tax=Caenorhabditis brenneri TaxID=135651 RepID=G0NX74_CAEBE|nr:hypothetical protein CAEBREN_29512 [Caenorhabditis brenneri]